MAAAFRQAEPAAALNDASVDGAEAARANKSAQSPRHDPALSSLDVQTLHRPPRYPVRSLFLARIVGMGSNGVNASR